MDNNDISDCSDQSEHVERTQMSWKVAGTVGEAEEMRGHETGAGVSK